MSGWILLSDRLPEDGTWNLFKDGKNISVERYKSDAFDHFFPPGDGSILKMQWRGCHCQM